MTTDDTPERSPEHRLLRKSQRYPHAEKPDLVLVAIPLCYAVAAVALLSGVVGFGVAMLLASAFAYAILVETMFVHPPDE